MIAAKVVICQSPSGLDRSEVRHHCEVPVVSNRSWGVTAVSGPKTGSDNLGRYMELKRRNAS